MRITRSGVCLRRFIAGPSSPMIGADRTLTSTGPNPGVRPVRQVRYLRRFWDSSFPQITARESMVRKGSTVRVRQRALHQTPRSSAASARSGAAAPFVQAGRRAPRPGGDRPRRRWRAPAPRRGQPTVRTALTTSPLSIASTASLICSSPPQFVMSLSTGSAPARRGPAGMRGTRPERRRPPCCPGRTGPGGCPTDPRRRGCPRATRRRTRASPGPKGR